MTFFWLLLAAFFWVANTGSALVHYGAKPRGSQIPRQDEMQASYSDYACPVDPRVQSFSMVDGACTRLKRGREVTEWCL